MCENKSRHLPDEVEMARYAKWGMPAVHQKVAEFMQAHRGRWSSSTQKLYTYYLDDLGAYLGHKKFRSVSTRDLVRWLEVHTEWGASRRYSAICAARAFYRWLKGGDNPAEALILPKRNPPPQRTLTQDQVVQLLASIDTYKPRGVRDMALVTLLLDTGLRSGEVCNLLLKHLDMDQRRLMVRVKGGQWGEAVFGPFTQASLDAWLMIRPRYALPETRAVFCSIKGTKPGSRLTPDGLRSVFRVMGKRAGLGLISPHDMRRTFATLALRAGAPTRLVQIAGRWKDIQMVERYSRALEPSDFEGYFPTDLLGFRVDE